MLGNNFSGKQQQSNHPTLDSVKSRGKVAFDKLPSHYLEAVFRFFYSQINNIQDAEDLTETAFNIALGSHNKPNQSDATFLANLFKVTSDLLEEHQNRISGEDAITTDNDPDQSEIQTGGSQSSDQFRQQETLRLALNKLSDDYQTVLVSRFLCGLSIQETAQLMARTPDRVLILQHRALSALHQILN